MACEEKCFTFTWKLENASYCLQKKGFPILSPSFTVDSIDETKWYLGVYPRGKECENYVGLYLFRDTNSKGDDLVQIRFQVTLVVDDCSAPTLKDLILCNFPKNKGHGISKLEKRDNVFREKRSVYLPQDTLTARCRIWKSDGEMPEDVQCCARTRIGVMERSIMWQVKNFSTLEYGKKYTYEIKSLSDCKQLISLNLSLTEGLCSEGIVCFELSLQDRAIKLSTLRLSLIDASGNKIECNRDEFWFDDGAKAKEFKFFFTKNKLMSMKSSYLPDDILSLHWEWAFSKGIIIEDDFQYASFSSKSKTSNTQGINDENVTHLSYSLNDNLKSLYNESFLCDVKLKTSTRTFSAHRVILSSASSVFKAMFSSDMKENNNDCVHIEDLSDDTVSGTLDYIYTSHTEDLTWDRAYHLYIAADKYAIFSLKNICSSYLKDNVSLKNACEVLLLSEFHADENLKSAIQAYILKHVKDIVNSGEWEHLLETNAKLAAETLSLQYK